MSAVKWRFITVYQRPLSFLPNTSSKTVWSRGFPVWEVLLVSRPLFGIVSFLVVYLQDVLNSLLTLAASDVSGKYQTLLVILLREWVRKQAAKRSVFNLPWLNCQGNKSAIPTKSFYPQHRICFAQIPSCDWYTQHKHLTQPKKGTFTLHIRRLNCKFKRAPAGNRFVYMIARLPSHGNGAVWFF